MMEVAANSSFGPAVCRVCLCGESSIPYLGNSAGEPLISPCHCKGTMGLYHRSCLEHWLSTSKTANCEICHFKYEIGRRNRPFRSYLRARGWEKKVGMNGRNIYTDSLCFALISPVAWGVTFLCLKTAISTLCNMPSVDDDMDEVETNAISTAVIEMVAMFVLASFIIVVYVLWFAVSVAYHLSEFRVWQRNNQIVYIVDQLDANQSLRYNTPINHLSESRSPLISRKVRGFVRIILRVGRSRPTQMTNRDPVIGISPQLIAVFERNDRDFAPAHARRSTAPSPESSTPSPARYQHPSSSSGRAYRLEDDIDEIETARTSHPSPIVAARDFLSTTNPPLSDALTITPEIHFVRGADTVETARGPVCSLLSDHTQYGHKESVPLVLSTFRPSPTNSLQSSVSSQSNQQARDSRDSGSPVATGDSANTWRDINLLSPASDSPLPGRATSTPVTFGRIVFSAAGGNAYLETSL